MRMLSLFSGIGGIDLAGRWLGWTTEAFCEIDPFCRRVLAHHWPGVPIHEDIRQLDGALYRGRVDIVAGGFPCQDISEAGRKAGISGSRSGLWGEMLRIVCESRPRYIVVENVSALLGRGLDRVLSDLSSAGFDAEWEVLSACESGAPHTRERVFIVAYPSSERLDENPVLDRISHSSLREATRDSWRSRLDYGNGFKLRRVPDFEFHRMAYGISDTVDRVKSLGNAIVPQVAYLILRAIDEADRN